MKHLSDEVGDLLAPVIGEGIAHTLITMQCRRMQILPEDLTYRNISELADRCYPPLMIFAGDEIASEIVGRMKRIAPRTEDTGP